MPLQDICSGIFYSNMCDEVISNFMYFGRKELIKLENSYDESVYISTICRTESLLTKCGTII